MKDFFTLNDIILLSQNENSKMTGQQCEPQNWCGEAPDERIISNLLSYSQALTVVKTKRVGTINLLMN